MLSEDEVGRNEGATQARSEHAKCRAVMQALECALSETPKAC